MYRSSFRARMQRVLYAAYAAGCSHVVLGAWGCGVFGNDPSVVAALWREVLQLPEWRGRFACVIFAILPGVQGRSLAAFRAALLSSPFVS